MIYSKQHHRKVSLSRFYLNGHIQGFRPHTQTLEHSTLHDVKFYSANESVKEMFDKKEAAKL